MGLARRESTISAVNGDLDTCKDTNSDRESSGNEVTTHFGGENEWQQLKEREAVKSDRSWRSENAGLPVIELISGASPN